MPETCLAAHTSTSANLWPGQSLDPCEKGLNGYDGDSMFRSFFSACAPTPAAEGTVGNKCHEYHDNAEQVHIMPLCVDVTSRTPVYGDIMRCQQAGSALTLLLPINA